ncbi:twin-arginine translocation signal domain-containing protein, partial [Micrococcus endophyticus]
MSTSSLSRRSFLALTGAAGAAGAFAMPAWGLDDV